VPPLRVGMQPLTLCVNAPGTQSVRVGVTTQSVGTINTTQGVSQYFRRSATALAALVTSDVSYTNRGDRQSAVYA
jgi:hypothetical protein